jgi:putative flippase GtrA
MAAKPLAGTLARQFVSFTLVGLAGLGVDAGVFVLLTGTFLWSIALARTVSVCGSVFTTWVLNRAVVRRASLASARSPIRAMRPIRAAVSS